MSTYDHQAEVEKTRRQWFKKTLWLIGDAPKDANGNERWYVIYKPNKTSAVFGTVSSKCGTWNIVHQICHYQAPGHAGRYVGFQFTKGFDYDVFPKTILDDLHHCAIGNWEGQNPSPYPHFDWRKTIWS